MNTAKQKVYVIAPLAIALMVVSTGIIGCTETETASFSSQEVPAYTSQTSVTEDAEDEGASTDTSQTSVIEDTECVGESTDTGETTGTEDKFINGPSQGQLPSGGPTGQFPGQGQPNSQMMEDIAGILDIDQETLENAFAQARSELQNTGEGDMRPQALTARVAEILGIEQQKLQEAFTQIGGRMMDRGPKQPPSNGPPR
jgi:hypothetical protein